MAAAAKNTDNIVKRGIELLKSLTPSKALDAASSTSTPAIALDGASVGVIQDFCSLCFVHLESGAQITELQKQITSHISVSKLVELLQDSDKILAVPILLSAKVLMEAKEHRDEFVAAGGIQAVIGRFSMTFSERDFDFMLLELLADFAKGDEVRFREKIAEVGGIERLSQVAFQLRYEPSSLNNLMDLLDWGALSQALRVEGEKADGEQPLYVTQLLSQIVGDDDFYCDAIREKMLAAGAVSALREVLSVVTKADVVASVTEALGVLAPEPSASFSTATAFASTAREAAPQGPAPSRDC